VDVYYADEPPRAVVKADLAGVVIEDVALEIRGRQLLIAGERRTPEGEGRLYQQIEIEHGPFRRLVELGADVVAEEAKASYEDGILQVEIPLARPDQAVRRVPIEEGGTE
jgi:HSP20 family protein